MKTGQKPQRVFVVDDEPMIAWSLAEILRKSGFDATAFTNPQDALRTAESDLPDLLLSDVLMPQLSGVELAIRVRQLCPVCKVLLMSGHAATRDILDEANGNGRRFDLLTKPVHPEVLILKVRDAISHAGEKASSAA
jgi:DNA-binding NtrC family response regulator